MENLKQQSTYIQTQILIHSFLTVLHSKMRFIPPMIDHLLYVAATEIYQNQSSPFHQSIQEIALGTWNILTPQNCPKRHILSLRLVYHRLHITEHNTQGQYFERSERLIEHNSKIAIALVQVA